MTNLQIFIAAVQALSDEYYAANYPNLQAPRYEAMDGVKFNRIIRVGQAERSAFAFVSIETGDIFKPDGWKRPAKHARGNINSEFHGLEAVSADGQFINYRR